MLFCRMMQETVYGIQNVRMQICSPDDRIFCAELMKRLHIGTGQRWCKEQIDCCAFSGIEHLVMVDHVRENQRKVTFLHVIEVLSDAEFERSLGDIDALHGFMHMRRNMTSRSQIDFQIILYVFI